MCSRVPHGFTTPYCKTDIRWGGAYRLCMRSPEGREYWLQGVYREIVESEPIVFTCALENEELSHLVRGASTSAWEAHSWLMAAMREAG
jgi:uncharacterized protein YndB with AHSA1/START domain